MAETGTRRVPKRAAQRRGTISPAPAALSPGDTLEYSLTAEIKSARTGNWWLKVGSSTALRANETPVQAKERLVTFVHSLLDERANELLSK